MIVAERASYVQALQTADESFVQGVVDIREMEDLMARLLAKQLLGVYNSATGTGPSASTGTIQTNG